MRVIRRALGAAGAALVVAAMSCGGEVTAIPDPCSWCDDGVPCTIDTCDADGVCSHAPAYDGFVPPDTGLQVEGDCWETICVGGELDERINDADAPLVDDPCVTFVTCQNGAPFAFLVTPGTPCMTEGLDGVCNVDGACVSSQCASCLPPNGCITATCDILGTCVMLPVPDGALPDGMASIPGDCQASICVGGEVMVVPDDADVPKAPSCQEAACSGGVPVFTPSPLHAPCGPSMTGVCDPEGGCVECLDDADCVMECNTGVCKQGVCAWTPADEGAPCGCCPPGVCVGGNCLI